MPSVAIHPPKTPVTKGSMGIAKATTPNVCKMPGPPAPFVPTPLPNIARSGTSPKGYSTKVKIEGNPVAIRGSSFKSMGDMASKGTGGGVVSANTHGPAKFITPGSLSVKIQGKAVHLLGEPMLNNCAASGTPPNTGATMTGLSQGSANVGVITLKCEDDWDDCQKAQMKAKAKKLDGLAKQGKMKPRNTYADGKPTLARKNGNGWAAKFARDWDKPNPKGWPDFSNPGKQDSKFFDDCAETADPKGKQMQADHVHEMQLGGNAKGPFLWLDKDVNEASGRQIKNQLKSNPQPTGFEADC
ncbi:MAG: hypothetical protein CML06_00700 [Pseudomonadales bacterium]|nr:hypothetical protein [Pseudomonadales bacterium]